MKNQAPFLNIMSFEMEEESRAEIERETSVPRSSPFLSLYESDETGGFINPESEEYVVFLNELQDEEFHEALASVWNEAAAIYETRFAHEQGDPQTIGYQAERLLNQHFAPLVAEAEGLFDGLAKQFSQRHANSLTEAEIETLVDRYQPSIELAPNFEEFLGSLKKLATKGLKWAKQGISAATALGLGPLLEKLKKLIKPLFNRVIQFAIPKLPAQLQPIARKLAERVPFLKEFEESTELNPASAEVSGIGQIQQEFNQNIANLLFAATEVEQDLEIAQVLTAQQVPETYPLAELDRARDQFVTNLQRLKEGEDPTPHVEQFLPALLPALRIGIRLVGRRKVVDYLANLVGKLIQKFVGPQYTRPLSQAIVDAGLRLINLEATAEDEARAAASAVAATVEETVRRIAALPDYVMDNQELLEGFALEAFEQAAAANLPQVLPDETYRQRPDLAEARKLRSTWIMMPQGRRKRYKKFCRKIPVKITPHKVSELETFVGTSMQEFLEEELGIAPGEEVAAVVHLFEAIPGTRTSDIAQLEESLPGLRGPDGYKQLQPLSREAAQLLLGEPDLGREVDPHSSADRYMPAVGQRLFYLEIAGKKPLMMPGADGRSNARRPTQVRLTLDFPKNEVQVRLFLGEIRAQEVAVKLRQRAHLGLVMTRVGRIVERGLNRALLGSGKRLKIIHEAVTPDHWISALRRLPSHVSQVLAQRLQEWVLKGLTEHLKQNAEEFIKAAEDIADGVTLVITLGNPPGLPQLRQALKGKGVALTSLKLADGAPTVKIKISSGYSHD